MGAVRIDRLAVKSGAMAAHAASDTSPRLTMPCSYWRHSLRARLVRVVKGMERCLGPTRVSTSSCWDC